MSFDDFITFRKYITPAFVTIVYILGALFITILAFWLVYESTKGGYLAQLYGVFGLMTLIFGNLFWRLVCEQMVVLFRIFDELRSMNRKLGRREK